MRSGEEEWTLLENVKGVDDIISFNGKFYVVDREGRTIVIDQSLNISFLGCVGSGRRAKKYLVRSVDDLLAVEMLHDTYEEDPITLWDKKVAGFKVFKMNEEEQKWEEMGSLRDRIMFLSYRQAISAPASEFCSGKGNLIFFHSTCLVSARGLVFVFDLETGTASPLENCPAYFNLFWPPPQWVTSPESVISSTRVISNSAHSTTSSPAEIECKYPESNFTTSTTASSAGKVDSEHPSPRPKCSFKFCCF
ncbi:hypothetical protein V6N12_006498 [Hibiscus sabdariffa]|uniref:KIB1-4 beta-propeller domain-containing protein n=1 Tax=Hibiscus sabdariffa TaxID=183260 RepID=A0ABR2EZ09_9ROSI